VPHHAYYLHANTHQVLEQAVQCRAGVLLSDDTLCKSFQAAFMLGDPISKPKEYGDIMGYYSRQVVQAQCKRTLLCEILGLLQS
jgi:brefeldin A-resistance guanine nucleotide exchange factor 1